MFSVYVRILNQILRSEPRTNLVTFCSSYETFSPKTQVSFTFAAYSDLPAFLVKDGGLNTGE